MDVQWASTGWAIELPVWFGGLSESLGGSRFGAPEMLLTGISVGIIFAILLPKWLQQRRSR